MTSNAYGGLGADLVPGTLRGFRVWQPTHGARLASLTMSYVWAASTVEAQCMAAGNNSAIWGGRWGELEKAPPVHEVPERRCTCGIYARHRPDTYQSSYINGVIEAWGRIELGSEGFRAQHSRICALAMPNVIMRDEFAEFIRILEGTYKGVRFFPSNEAMWQEFPPIDVTELLKAKQEQTQPDDIGWL